MTGLTGDLVFVNDLFGKDWNSFFIGRDDEYLKAPTDAVKTSMFFDALNIDVIYMPKFGADRFIDGKRLSFFNFYSPSDEDGYLRFNASYKLSDSTKIEGGGNYFYGNKDHTFFAQFKNNSNIYAAIRYEF